MSGCLKSRIRISYSWSEKAVQLIVSSLVGLSGHRGTMANRPLKKTLWTWLLTIKWLSGESISGDAVVPKVASIVACPWVHVKR